LRVVAGGGCAAAPQNAQKDQRERIAHRNCSLFMTGLVSSGRPAESICAYCVASHVSPVRYTTSRGFPSPFSATSLSSIQSRARSQSYLHALTDLRTARWMLEHRRGDAAVSGQEDARAASNTFAGSKLDEPVIFL